MIKSCGCKIVILLVSMRVLCMASYAQAEKYEWLKSPDYESILVVADFSGFESIADKLNETVKKSFSRQNIKATISSSLTFIVTGESKDSVYELVDEALIGKNKIILNIYGKCIKYTSGHMYQFDVHFGVNNAKYSQALLYSTPRHSVIGVDSIMGIDSIFRKLMKNVVNDYWTANQQ